jgi:hypothetical protein
MGLRKFGPNEIVLNTMRTFPPVEYFIYNGNVYYNNTPHQSGTLTDNVLAVTGGAVSLYEYNVDRRLFSDAQPSGIWDPWATINDAGEFVGAYVTARYVGQEEVEDTGRIYPFITKDSARSSFKTVGAIDYTNEFANYDTLTANYPLGGHITREIMPTPGERRTEIDLSEFFDSAAAAAEAGFTCPNCPTYKTTPIYPHFYALKNRLNHYGYLSEHYKVSSSFSSSLGLGVGWDKAIDTLNLVSVPAIMFGSTIKKGTISLKWYFTGSLLGELRDTKQNGELIETIGAHAGAVGGVVLYDEGLFVLTGSWVIPGALNTIAINATAVPRLDWPRWIYFAAGAHDGHNPTDTGESFCSASFNMSFQGQTDIQVYTMFANARRGEVNYSTNPTFLEHGQTFVQASSTTVYQENSTLRIKNTISSSYLDYEAPFKKQVFISRIGIYDDSKNLIAIATLADPILKKEEQDYTFKIKLDI